MPLRSRFAKPSSISGRGALPAFLVAVTVVAAALAAIGVAISSASVAATGLVVATTFAGAFAVYLIVSERRRHESAEDQLQGEARFLESLVRSMAAVADSEQPGRDSRAHVRRVAQALRRPLGRGASRGDGRGARGTRHSRGHPRPGERRQGADRHARAAPLGSRSRAAT